MPKISNDPKLARFNCILSHIMPGNTIQPRTRRNISKTAFWGKHFQSYFIKNKIEICHAAATKPILLHSLKVSLEIMHSNIWRISDNKIHLPIIVRDIKCVRIPNVPSHLFQTITIRNCIKIGQTGSIGFLVKLDSVNKRLKVFPQCLACWMPFPICSAIPINNFNKKSSFTARIVYDLFAEYHSRTLIPGKVKDVLYKIRRRENLPESFLFAHSNLLPNDL